MPPFSVRIAALQITKNLVLSFLIQSKSFFPVSRCSWTNMIFASKPNKYLILALSRLVTLVWKIRLPSGGTRPVAARDIRGVSGEF